MILVTGASGNIGTALVQRLKERGSAHRVAARIVTIDDASTVRLNFYDPSSFAPAVEGCDAVFLLRPPAISRMKSTLNAFIDVARRAGVAHIVFVSVAGADRNAFVPHHAVERHLQAGPRDWTILRPGFFAQNLIDAYRRDIVEDDRIYVPASDGRVAFIDARDVADVAATVLLEREPHLGRAYVLIGPERLTFSDVAKILTDELGRPIEYRTAGVFGYIVHLAKRGVPIVQILVQTLLHIGLRASNSGLSDATLGNLLGRPPRSMREFVCDHLALMAHAPAGRGATGNREGR